ncbi:hypothetical protein [Streptomyces sp. NPDC093093]|uniref:hypothetical protein n=1 Tax=Streptomyces sp. NPDC093093 TaxID=3366025 RepID=UPI0038076EB6
MSDTTPTARERLIAKVAFGSDRYEADFLAELDAYRAEVLAEAASTPLVVRRFDCSIEPALEDEHPELLVCCVAEDGRPVALLLDDAARAKLRQLLGDQRAEVMQEAARIALSLRQFEKITGARWAAQVSENVGILRVAEALAAEGKGTPAGFYQPGQTYRRDNGTWAFRCDMVTTHPEDGELTALGWRYFRGEWTEYAYGPDDWDIDQFGLKLDASDGGR